MKKCTILLYILILFFHSNLSAEDTYAKNEIKIDFSPWLVSGFFESMMDKIYAETTGFGLKLSYERMISGNFSVGGSFSFATITTRDVDDRYIVKIFSSDSEVHSRYYPWANAFFLYTGFGLVSFDLNASGNSTGIVEDLVDTFEPYNGISGIFDLGLGWRFRIKKHFIIEPLIMYGFYLGDVFSATTLTKAAGGMVPAFLSDRDNFKYRFDIALAIGWAF
jgi:hypothetical protein